MSYTSMLSGRSVAEPAERLHHLARITGREAPFMVDMWHLSELDDSIGVMRLAKRWLTYRTWHRVDNAEYLTHDMDLAVHGDENTWPRFVPVLLPIARALESAGRVDDARAIVEEIPSLIEQARILDWGRLDLMAIFADIRHRLDVGEPSGLTLQEQFDRLCVLIETYPTDESSTGIDIDPSNGWVAPPTFTRIRDV